VVLLLEPLRARLDTFSPVNLTVVLQVDRRLIFVVESIHLVLNFKFDMCYIFIINYFFSSRRHIH
jgi:hypothetical protein